MSGNEQTATFEADNPKGQRFELVAQYPGQVKISRPPRRRSVRPRRSNVEQRRFPDAPPSDDPHEA